MKNQQIPVKVKELHHTPTILDRFIFDEESRIRIHVHRTRQDVEERRASSPDRLKQTQNDLKIFQQSNQH